MEWEVLKLTQFLPWPFGFPLGAKAHKPGIRSFENPSVVMVFKIYPLYLADVALRVNCLHPAVKLITNLVEWLILVCIKEYFSIDSIRNRVVLCDLVPKNIGLILTIEAQIVFALGNPVMAREDDRGLGSQVVHVLKVANFLICTDLDRTLNCSKSTITFVLELNLAVNKAKLMALRTDRGVNFLSTLD